MVTSQSKNKCSIKVSGLSLLSSVWVIPVTPGTTKLLLLFIIDSFTFVHIYLLLFRMLTSNTDMLYVRTRLVKVGWYTGTGEATILAAMSVIWSL